MSQIAILKAVPAYLIERMGFDWKTSNCRAMPDGQPDPTMGELFCSVHSPSWRPDTRKTDGILEERWGFSCTITQRISAVPYDRLMQVYLTELTELLPAAQRLEFTLKNRYALMQKCNENLTNNPTKVDLELAKVLSDEKFMTPFQLLPGTGLITFHTEQWFHGTHGANDARDSRDGYTGASITYAFGEALKLSLPVEPEICS